MLAGPARVATGMRWQTGSQIGGKQRTIPKLKTQPSVTAKAPKAAEAPAFTDSRANPYSNFYNRLRHKHMIMMCLGCGAAGLLAGKFVDLGDEEELRKKILAPFDIEEIDADLQKTFEFRPDLAPTMIRLAFVAAADRAVQRRKMKPPCPAHAPASSETGFDACRSARGLHDALNTIDTLKVAYPMVSRSDLVAIAAITAVRFLRGPANKIEFKWNRLDPEEEMNQAKKEDSLTFMEKVKAPKGAVYDPPKRDPEFMFGGSGNVKVYNWLNQICDDLSLYETVALMAAHCAGEWHEDVSGINARNYNRVSRHKYHLGVHYYQLLIDLSKGQFQPANLPPRPKDRPDQPTSPEMLEASADMVHPTTGKRMTRLGLVTKAEVDSIALDGEAIEIATSFAMDPKMWQEEFAKGMTKLLNSGHEQTLRSYHNPAVKRRRDAEKRARQEEWETRMRDGSGKMPKGSA